MSRQRAKFRSETYCRTAIAAAAIGFLTVLKNCKGFGWIPLPLVAALWIAGVLYALKADGFRGMKVNWLIALFLLVAGVTIFITPSEIRNLQLMRYCALICGLVFLSPLVSSPTLCRLRRSTAAGMLLMMIVAVVVSFIWWIVYQSGIDMPDFLQPDHKYAFSGVFNHGNALSPLGAIVAIFCLYYLLDDNLTALAARIRIRASAPTVGIALLICGMIGATTCIIAGSRITLPAMLVGLGYVIFIRRRRFMAMIRTKAGIITTAAILIVGATAMPRMLRGIILKTELNMEHGTPFASRVRMWDARIEEFRSSPVIGIGYANEPLKSKMGIIGKDDLSIDKNEPGSGYLSVLSYTGVIGGVLMLAILLQIGYALWVNRRHKDVRLQIAILILLAINATCEGWLLYAGATLFSAFWLCCNAPIQRLRK